MKIELLHISILGLILVYVIINPAMGDIAPYATIEEVTDCAELIVRGSQEPNNTILIKKIYKGQTKANKITIYDLEHYQTSVHFYDRYLDSNLPADIGKSDVVAFLVSREDGTFYPCSSGAGVKRIYDGHVFAYHQPENPGWYALSLSHETDTDNTVLDNWGNRDALNVKLLEEYISIGIRKSRNFNNAVSLTDPEKRVYALAGYIITLYGHSNYYARKALDVLAEIGELSIPTLLSTLKSDVCNPGRSDLIRCLGRTGSAEAIPFLLQEIKESTPGCRRMAIYALGELKAAAAFKPLCDILNHSEDDELTKAAISALGKIGDPNATASIILHLSSENERIRTEILDALSILKDKRAFDPLVKALGEPSRKGDTYFRSRALDVLYRCDKARGVPIFIEHLRSPEPEVAHSARTCLLWTSRELEEMKNYAEFKAWYDRQPKDENNVIILNKGQ